MATATKQPSGLAEIPLPLLHSGDRLSQREFHRRYEAYPEDVKFELIEGLVYMASPTGLLHGTYDPEITTLFTHYKAVTPGVQVAHNVTMFLGRDSAVQPDIILRILPEYGGRSKTTKINYVSGPPELVAEIAYSSAAIDLHKKKDVYARAGVLEYIVVCLSDLNVSWFDFATGQQRQYKQGMFRSRVFPGLWIDAGALLRADTKRLLEVLEQGIATQKHADFVKLLEARHAKRSRVLRRLPRKRTTKVSRKKPESSP